MEDEKPETNSFIGSRFDTSVPESLHHLTGEIYISHPSFFLYDTYWNGDIQPIIYQDETITAKNTRIATVVVEKPHYSSFEKAVLDDDSVDQVELISRGSSYMLYRLNANPDAVQPIGIFAEFGFNVLDVKLTENGWGVKFSGPSRDELVSLTEYLKSENISFALRELHPNNSLDVPRIISEEKEDLIRLAYDTGYFDVPRKISQEELAAETSISAPAVSQNLRVALKRLIEHSIIDDVDEGKE